MKWVYEVPRLVAGDVAVALARFGIRPGDTIYIRPTRENLPGLSLTDLSLDDIVALGPLLPHLKVLEAPGPGQSRPHLELLT